MSARRDLPIALAIVASALLASGARAHLGHEVQTAERYLKVDVADDHVRVVVSLMLGPSEAARVLAIADREAGDGDGVLGPGEAEAYMSAWGEGLGVDLVVELDSEPATLVFAEPYLDPTGVIAARPATVEMVARLPLTEGTHRITLRDRMQRETYDRTDVAFRAREGAELVASGAGEQPEARTVDLAFAGDRGPDVFTAVVEVPGAEVSDTMGDDEARSWTWLAAIIALVAAVAFAAFRLRSGRGS